MMVSLVVFLLCTSVPLSAQWKQTGELYGGPVSSLAVDDATHYFYAGSVGGVYVSKDSGESWAGASNGLINYNIISLVSYDGKVYTATDGGVSVTANNGDSWSTVNDGLTDTYVRSLVVCNNRMFVGTWSGLYYYDSVSGTWILSNSGLPVTTYVNSMAAIGTSLFAGTESAGVFISTDNGITWSAVNNNLNLNISCLGVNGTTLFAGTPYWGMYRTSDNGSSWSQVNDGSLPDEIHSITTNNGIIYASTGSFLVYSSDNGDNWFSRSPVSTNYFEVEFSGDNIIAATEKGIYYSVDEGVTWNIKNTGLSVIQCSSIITHGGTIYAGVTGIIKSDDYGISFSSANGTPDVLSGTLISQLIPEGTHIYALTGEGEIFYTIDEGKTWMAEGGGLGYILQLAVNGSLVYAVISSQGIYKSTDNGIHWQPANTGLPSNMCSVTAVDNMIFAGTWDGKIYKSDDYAATWSLANTGLTTIKAINVIFYDRDLLFAGTNGDGLFISDNNGDSWTKITTGIPSDTFLSSILSYGNNFIAGTSDGVFISSDEGKTWSSANDGLMIDDIKSLCISNGDIYAAVYNNGIWKRPLVELGIVTFIREQSDYVVLVYPNPSRDVLYVTGLSGDSRFSIFDINGRLAGSGLIRGNCINISKLSRGIYNLIIYEHNVKIVRRFIKM